jgi:ATP-dependent Lon protease
MGDGKGHALEDALHELPISPVVLVVLFPHAMLPLHVFELRYRALLRDALATHKAIGMAHILHPDDLDERGQPRIAEIGGVGIIVEHQPLPDGRANVLLHGRGRVRLEELPFVPPYRRAQATLLHDLPVPVSAGDRTALVAAAGAFSSDVRRRDSNFSFGIPQSLDAGAVADLCAHHLIIDSGIRQELLAELDPNERGRRVTAALAAQHAALLRESGGLLH